ncbi:MAG TPA: hypothetical protein VFN10_11555 [Thermoanaerobaculia bacterium]|nr:hypothetical protein [Thermoanaerobaculia bacterium]
MADEPEKPEYDAYLMSLTPGERVEMVWQLTVEEWRRKEPGWEETALRRDVVNIIRPKR